MDDLCDIKPPSELRKSSIDTGLDEDNSRPVVTQQFLKYMNGSVSTIELCGMILLFLLLLVAGILVVCFTSPKPKPIICPYRLVSENLDWIIEKNLNLPIALGDFNNDNHLDTLITQRDTNKIEIFFGYGNGIFPDHPILTAISSSIPYSLVVGDFNNDSSLDFAAANYASHSIGIFLGYGNGSFGPENTFSTGSSRPLSLSVGDFNNDKRLDIVVVNYGTNDIGLLFGYGNGSFADIMRFSTGFDSNPRAVAIGDFNNDKTSDIAVANSGTQNVGIFLGQGNGTFLNQITYSTDGQSISLAIGDLNKDNHLDIVVAHDDVDNIQILLGHGDGSFMKGASYKIGVGSNSKSLVVSDFNKDGRLDIITANSGSKGLSFFLGNGDGTFKSQRLYPISTGSPQIIAAHDLNSDTWIDIVFTIDSSYDLGIFLGGPDKNFSNISTYSTGGHSAPYSVALAYFNNDTKLDFAMVNYGISDMRVFLGDGYGGFTLKFVYSTGEDSGPVSVAVGDLNNDGRMDIVIAMYTNGKVGIYFGHGDGTFPNQIVYLIDPQSAPMSVAIGDLNNDKIQDIVVANSGTNNIAIMLGNGDGNFSDMILCPTGLNSVPYSVIISDFNQDHNMDMAVAYYGSDMLAIFIGFGNGTFIDGFQYFSYKQPYSVAVGDFNNDKKPDVAVANSGADNIGIFLGLGGGMFSNQTTYSTGSGSSPYSVAVGDLNNDTVLDLIVANYKSGEIGVLLGNGNGTFSSLTTYPTGYASMPVFAALGDFNSDDRLDVAVVLSNFFSIGIFLGYYNSPFVVADMYSGGSILTPYAFAIADFDNDDRSDLVTTNFDDGTLAIFSNFVNGTFLNYSVLSTSFITGLYSVAVGDFNNDNQSDIVAANYLSDSIIFFLTSGNGSFRNAISYSTGTNSGPCSVAVGDFTHDGRVDVINANNLDNSIVLFLHNGFGSFGDKHKYTTTSVKPARSVAFGDFNKDGRMDLVVGNNDDFSIAILLGNGDGTFSDPISYATGDNSWPFSVAVGDFDGDTVLDIAVSNSYGFNVGIFIGKGNGTFFDQIRCPTGPGSRPFTVGVGDFNNDTRLDLVVTNYVKHSIGIFLGVGDGTFSNRVEYDTGYSSSPWAVTVGDLNNDARLDIVVSNQYGFTAGVFLGNGDGTFSNQIAYPTGDRSKPNGIVLGDFNKDKNLDIAIANYGTDNVGIFFGKGDGKFSDQIKISTGPVSGPYWVAVGDFNRDGNLDFVAALSLSDTIGVCFGDGNGSFSNIVIYGTGAATYPWLLTTTDLNSDGWLDVAVVFGNVGGVTVFLGDENKMFLVPMKTTTSSYSAPQAIAVGDFNQDQNLDAVVAYSKSDCISILFGHRNGLFSNQVIYSTGKNSEPWSLALGDLNNDAISDIVVVNRNHDNIGVFIGIGNGTFRNLMTFPTGALSNPVSLAILDFNRDDKPDIVVANKGSNSINILEGNGNGTFSNEATYLTGYSSEPSWVITGDFDRDGWMDVVTSTVGTKNIKILLKLC